MKKKILFMVINMNVGGTEKALLNLIEGIPKEKYDITILMLEDYGGFLKYIPEGVHVEVLNKYKDIKHILNNPPIVTAIDLLKSGKVLNAIIFSFFYLFSKIINDKRIFYHYITERFQKFENAYDLAISFAGPMDLITYFIVKKIKSKRKIQWIHFDITKIGFNKKFANQMYKNFNKIFVVSNEAKEKLICNVPNIHGKTEVFYNIVSPHLIIEQSKEGIGFEDKFDGLRILTVGRLSKEKGQDLAIRVMARLVNDGLNVKWYCVGEGASRIEYEKLIRYYQLEDRFILLGLDPNPYSYIDQCDIYVQPSRYEGYCITLIEARCLNKPIVTTAVNGSYEQIKNEDTGLIVDINEDELYKAVKRLVLSNDLRSKFSENLTNDMFGSEHEMKKLLNLI
jgi:glycosyltransferase involved in cell wall biosynthesis